MALRDDSADAPGHAPGRLRDPDDRPVSPRHRRAEVLLLELLESPRSRVPREPREEIPAARSDEPAASSRRGMTAFTAPATAPARTLAPRRFASFLTLRRLAEALPDLPLLPDALTFDVLPLLERRLARLLPLDRVVALFLRERVFELRLVLFLVAIAILLVLSLGGAVLCSSFASMCAVCAKQQPSTSCVAAGRSSSFPKADPRTPLRTAVSCSRRGAA